MHVQGRILGYLLAQRQVEVRAVEAAALAERDRRIREALVEALHILNGKL